MLYNYLITGLRTLTRYKFFSSINVFGLAIAMCICMTVMMLVADQLSYDRYNRHADRIFRVTTVDVDESGNVVQGAQVNAASSMPVGPALVESYTGVADYCRIRRGFGNHWLEFEGQNINIPIKGFFADQNALEFFQYELEYGNKATALKDPFCVVLTRQAANKFFTDRNPVGKSIKVGETLYTVTGVLKETSNKSHILFEGLGSMSSATSLESSGKLSKLSIDWTNYWETWTYIKLDAAEKKTETLKHLRDIYDKHIAHTAPAVHKMMFGLQPLLDITPGNIMNNSIGPQLPWVFVYFLGGLAFVILLASCFNFTNLSIARSLTRAREIGVRKVSGASRWQIFVQFISESVVVSMVALLLGVILLLMMEPMILQLNFARAFHWDLYNGSKVYLVFVLFAVVVGILAGLFPAVVLSGFQPIKVLKNLGNLKLFSRMGLRKLLLVSQFTLSLFFILTVVVMFNQLTLFTTHDHGFNTTSNIMIKLNNTSYQQFKNELEKYSNIGSISAASHVPAAGVSYGTSFKRTLEDPVVIDAGYFQVDENYSENMGLKLLAGTFFEEANGESNKNFVVINEAAAKRLSYEIPRDAIGGSIVFVRDSTSKTIVGVVQNYNHRDLTREITPAILLYDPSAFNVAQVAYSGTYADARSSIDKAWAAVNPGLKIDAVEVESEVKKFYEIIFGDLVKVLGFISFLAILISCLGLLGMATYATEIRMKEISIRKILGSSSAALVLLLSKGFMRMLAASIIIGVPLAYFVNGLWLNLIAYRTQMDLAVIALSVAVLIFFGIVTIGSQTLRATLVKPVDNLKND